MKRKILVFLVAITLILISSFSISAKSSSKPTKDFANVVVFVQFKDDATNFFKNADNYQAIKKMYDGEYDTNFTNYMNLISYGQFKVHNIFPQDKGTYFDPYVLSMNRNYFNDETYDDTAIIQQVLAKLSIESTKTIDYDNDNVLDNLTIIIRNDSDTNSGSSLYPHKADYNGAERVNGKIVSCYNILTTSRLMDGISGGSGLVAHEFMHSIGYPDLYTISGSTNPVGIWDLMASSSKYLQWPLAYMRYAVSGWVNIDTITSNQTITLNSQNTANGNQAYIIKSPANNQEIFVVEYRKKAASFQNLIDEKIGGSGIIVYRIDLSSGDLSNHHGIDNNVYVFRPSNYPQLEGYNSIENVQYAFLSAESGRTSIGSSDPEASLSEGALTFTDGSNSGIVISEIGNASGDTITCKVEINSTMDVWKNITTDSINNIATGIISTVNDGNNLYLLTGKEVDYGKNTLSINRYNGSKWSAYASNIVTNAYDGKLAWMNDSLYVIYTDYDSFNLKMKKVTNGSTSNVTLDLTNPTDYAIKAINNQLYVAYIENSQTLHIYQYQKETNNFTEISNYPYSGFIGKVQICGAGNNGYVSVRDVNNNKMEVYSLADNKFTKMGSLSNADDYCLTYSDDNKLYALTYSNTNLDIYLYNNGNFERYAPTLSGKKYSFNKFEAYQGKLYLLTLDQTNTSKTVSAVYMYNQNSWSQLSTNVGYETDETNLNILNDQVYVTLCKNNVSVYSHDVDNEKIITTVDLTPPNKTNYFIDEKIDYTGMLLTVNYDDGTNKELEISDYKISSVDMSVAGDKTITVTYKGISKSFNISVEDRSVESISITPPTKKNYISGDSIDLTGLKVVAHYTNGTTEEIPTSKCQISGSLPPFGLSEYQVSYKGKTASFTVSVKKINYIEVKKPTKLTYYQNEELDLTGMVVTAYYTDSTSEVLASGSYSVSGYDSSVGTKTIVISKNSYTDSFTVEVLSREFVGFSFTNPTKIYYLYGQYFDDNGMELLANYADGSSESIDSFLIKVSGFNRKKYGKQTISVKYDDFATTFSIYVKVKPKRVYIPTTVKVMVDSTYQFKPTVSPKSAYNVNYTYTSSNSNIATVDNNGLLTAKQTGTVTIKIKSVNGKTDSCKVYVQAKPTSVELNKDAITIMQSRSYTLSPKVLASSAYQVVSWSSDHPEIASVSSKGVVTGKTSGKATITVTTKNGLTDTCEVTVKPQPTKVDVISSKNVMLTTKYQIVTNLTPADAYDVLTYKSSNTKYVKVDKNGLVTPVRVGSAYITVKAANGKYDKIKINVKSVPTKIDIASSYTGYVTQNYKFSTTISSSTAYNDEKVWTSSNEEVATVDQSGNVTMLSKGTTVIKVETVNGKYDECNLTVKNLPTSMNIEPTSLNVMYKKSIYLHPVFEEEDAYPNCSYKSSNTKYVTVSSTGKVYGKYPGSATITVTDKAGHTDTIKIVVQKAPTKLSLNATSVTLMETMDYQITTKVNSSSYYNENYSYTSSNKAVATIDSTGKITALTPGYTLITVKSLNGLKKTCKVYVKAQPEAVAFTADNYQVMVGKTITVKALGTGENAYTPVSKYEIVTGNDFASIDSKTGVITTKQAGTITVKTTTLNEKSTTVNVVIKKEPTSITSDVTSLTVKKGKTITLAEHLTVLEANSYQVISYSSSNKSYATVTSNGTVKGVKAGKVYITCKTANGKYVKIKITVK